MIAFYLIFSYFVCFSAWAESQGNALPVPRFVSIRSNAANLHVGPGNQYPVEWKYVRANLPLEVIAEFDTWRLVRDFQGTQGWIHKSLLNGRRHVIILNKIRSLRTVPDKSSSVVAHVQPGVVAKVSECQRDWCKISVQSKEGKNYKGWISRRSLWGTYPNEEKF